MKSGERPDCVGSPLRERSARQLCMLLTLFQVVKKRPIKPFSSAAQARRSPPRLYRLICGCLVEVLSGGKDSPHGPNTPRCAASVRRAWGKFWENSRIFPGICESFRTFNQPTPNSNNVNIWLYSEMDLTVELKRPPDEALCIHFGVERNFTKIYRK